MRFINSRLILYQHFKQKGREMIEEYIDLLSQRDALDKKIKSIKSKIIEENKPNGEFGTFNFDGFSIVIPKKVEWDQDELEKKAKIYNFIKATYSISETLYKELPDEIQKELYPSRTVKQGTISIKI